ncbi:MAG: class I SAM-dependent methyltransferase [Planctomycetia bacterium]|nr:class I SAM-dependent methyltransferase [Planctomycetia bacterium]
MTSDNRSTNGSRSAERCPWCRAADAAQAWPGTEPDDFQVRRCRQCEHHFTVPVLGPDEIGPYYAETYYGNKNRRFNPLMERLVAWFRRRRAATLGRFAKIGKVLDVGCGRGLTLATLRSCGWQTRGCEYSETSSRYAREVLQLDVDHDGFRPSNYADGEFDAVIMWHVYEHLADARETLETCARIIKPGGILAIAVPNFDSLQAQATRYGWFHLDMPRHYSHFSAPWLRKHLATSGFRILGEFHGSAEQNPYGWIQSVLNRLGLRRNLLYDVLRQPSARSVKQPWRELPGQSSASVIGAALLLPFSLLMLLPEILLRRGATVEMYAVRESSTPAKTA